MYLTLTNTTQEAEAIGTPDGDWVDVLQPGAAYGYNDEAQVLIVGDKPDVREQFERAGEILGSVARKLLTLIAGRKQHAQRSGRLEHVTVAVANHGTNQVRAILGDGTTDVVVDPGKTVSLTAPGYIELRELGQLDESQLDGGSQPATA